MRLSEILVTPIPLRDGSPVVPQPHAPLMTVITLHN